MVLFALFEADEDDTPKRNEPDAETSGFFVGMGSIPAGFLAEDPNPTCTFAASICAFFFATAAATSNDGKPLLLLLGGFLLAKFL